jgi:hypothetical protein
MTQASGTIERAFQLARAGRCLTIEDIVRQLSAEGCESPQAHLAAKGIRIELRRLVKTRSDAAAVTSPGTATGEPVTV